MLCLVGIALDLSNVLQEFLVKVCTHARAHRQRQTDTDTDTHTHSHSPRISQVQTRIRRKSQSPHTQVVASRPEVQVQRTAQDTSGIFPLSEEQAAAGLKDLVKRTTAPHELVVPGPFFTQRMNKGSLRMVESFSVQLYELGLAKSCQEAVK